MRLYFAFGHRGYTMNRLSLSSTVPVRVVASVAMIGASSVAFCESDPQERDPRTEVASRQVVHSSHQYDKIEARLRQKRDVFIPAGTPFHSAIREFEKQSGIDIRPDWGNLAADEFDVDAVVELNSPELSLRQALEMLLDPLRLEIVMRDDHVAVTTEAMYRQRDEYLEVRVYEIGDLTFDEKSKQTLLALLRASAVSAAWNDEGGYGGEIKSSLGLCVVKQTQQAHARIEAMLNMLRAAAVADRQPDENLHPLAFSHSLEVDIEDRLRKPLDADFADGTTLEQALNAVSREVDVAILPDWEGALADEQIDRDFPVQLDTTGLTAREALRLIFKPLLLTSVTRGGRLYVTTQICEEEEAAFQETRVYRFGSLAPDRAAEEQLADLLRATVINAAWQEDLGFGGTMINYHGILVVTQTQAVHAQIETILDTVRRAHQSEND